MFLTILLSILMSFTPLQVESHQVCDAQNENIEIKQRENIFWTDEYVYISYNEIASTYFINAFYDEISTNPGNIYNTGVSLSQFQLGTPLIVDTYNSNNNLDLGLKVLTYIPEMQDFVATISIKRLKIEQIYSYLPSAPDSPVYPLRLNFYLYYTEQFTSYYLIEARCYPNHEYGNLDDYLVSVQVSSVSPNSSSYFYNGFLRYPVDTFNGLLPNKFYAPDTNLLLEQSYNQGYNFGFREGYDSGNSNGLATGYNRGYDSGVSDGQTTGYQNGYADGLAEAQTQDTLALQIFSGCVEIGLLPINVMLRMFEYEIFGINVAGFVSALLTIAIVIIVIRVVTGKKDD